MGLRIEREEFVNKTFRLNAKLMQEVAVISAKKNISVNRFVDIALRYALEHLEDNESNS